ncbi:hypothetical protein DF157_29850 [Burkholderia cenocepacia]|uniref:hypothetical protein n=1 Tax=Burkholderia cenocepacia TaxID=95486 RepID=UPI000F5A6E2F|nr:hypothetical protein [Burkholderia cenocepacia]RQU09771.1 hypothetical protein DF157_29850 [Burkholderia cenocepacia]
MRDADSATGYTTQITKTINPDRLSFSSKQFYLNRPLPNLLVARIGIPPIDQINTTPQSAVRTRYAWLKHRPSTHAVTCEKPAAARDSIIAAFNFLVSNDIMKFRNGIKPRLINNTNFNYMKIIN